LKLAAIFLLLGITLGTIGLVATYTITESVQDSSNTQLAETASQESRQIESWLQNYYNILNVVEEDVESDVGDAEQISQSFRRRTVQFPSILAIHYVDTSDGSIVASTNADLVNGSLATSSAPWTDNLSVDGQRHVTSPYTSHNVTRVAIAQRVGREADRVVVLELEIRVAAPVLGTDQANLDIGYTEVVTGTGQVVFSERPSRIGATYRAGGESRVVNTAYSAAVAETTLTDENPYIRDELRTNRYLVGYDRVEGTDWVVVKHARRDTVYGFAQSVFSAGIVATGVVVVLVALLGVLVGRNTSADIDRLVDKANEMEQGNLTVDFTTERIDNIGRLYSEFERTQRALREQIEQSKLIEHSYDLITVVDSTRTIRYQSPSVKHIVGLEAADVEGRDILTVVHDEDTETVRSAIQRVLEHPETEQRFEYRIQNAVGEWRYFEAVCENHLDDPFVDGLVLSSRDITERREREEELKETKRTLEQSNEKLEQFAGVVSHDLRNPLNIISGHVRLLDVDEDTRPHVDAIERSATRMENMIDDLLALSDASVTVDDPEQVPLADVAVESWETARTDDADFELMLNEATTVRANRDHLRHIFENLFRNAVDHNDLPLTVRVGLLDAPRANLDDDQRAGFFIEDDGDGISADERDEVFDHGYTTSNEGTGIGLSIVTDVVDAHDWEIGIAESDEGGARFEIVGVDVDS
jgi:PAS domain S-box-containing protein